MQTATIAKSPESKPIHVVIEEKERQDAGT